MPSYEYVVSACLAGCPCRYDGGSRPCGAIIRLVQSGRALPVCPESLSGLPAPRPPCEQKNGRVICRNGEDVTDAFLLGAERAFAKASASGARKAILKARSPSCGIGHIYAGSFDGTLCAGNGVFAQKLLAAGFDARDEEHLPEDLHTAR